MRVLSFIVPGLFLIGGTGLAAQGGRRIGVLGWTGVVLAVGGSVLGVVGGIANGDPVRAYYALRECPLYLSVWFVPLLAGLTIVGVSAVVRRPLRGLGAVALAMGSFGWCYHLTDSGAALESRTDHVGSGLLFSLAWVVWGIGLWARVARA